MIEKNELLVRPIATASEADFCFADVFYVYLATFCPDDSLKNGWAEVAYCMSIAYPGTQSFFLTGRYSHIMHGQGTESPKPPKNRQVVSRSWSWRAARKQNPASESKTVVFTSDHCHTKWPLRNSIRWKDPRDPLSNVYTGCLFILCPANLSVNVHCIPSGSRQQVVGRSTPECAPRVRFVSTWRGGGHFQDGGPKSEVVKIPYFSGLQRHIRLFKFVMWASVMNKRSDGLHATPLAEKRYHIITLLSETACKTW
jgi:hypothetical protein